MNNFSDGVTDYEKPKGKRLFQFARIIRSVNSARRLLVVALVFCLLITDIFVGIFVILGRIGSRCAVPIPCFKAGGAHQGYGTKTCSQ